MQNYDDWVVSKNLNSLIIIEVTPEYLENKSGGEQGTREAGSS